jgi:hypothetical protein
MLIYYKVMRAGWEKPHRYLGVALAHHGRRQGTFDQSDCRQPFRRTIAGMAETRLFSGVTITIAGIGLICPCRTEFSSVVAPKIVSLSSPHGIDVSWRTAPRGKGSLNKRCQLPSW